MRLSRSEQVHLLEIAHQYPGPLAEWLREWVAQQKYVGVNNTFTIESIPVPSVTPITLDNVVHASPSEPRKTSRKEKLEEKEALLDKVGYKELPVWQRKAIRKFLHSVIERVEETDRLPDSSECWLGDHPMEGWEDSDFYLWVVVGKWSRQEEKGFRKWGCYDCAEKIAATHPEAELINAID